jgi:hypothetical protein
MVHQCHPIMARAPGVLGLVQYCRSRVHSSEIAASVIPVHFSVGMHDRQQPCRLVRPATCVLNTPAAPVTSSSTTTQQEPSKKAALKARKSRVIPPWPVHSLLQELTLSVLLYRECNP